MIGYLEDIGWEECLSLICKFLFVFWVNFVLVGGNIVFLFFFWSVYVWEKFEKMINILLVVEIYINM